MIQALFQDMASKWPSTWVARTKIGLFSGYIITEKYIANLDSAGKGPPGRVRCGRKVVYPVAGLVSWLESRSAVIPNHHPAEAGKNKEEV
jgi:hypothetical protein